jgi:hypothetical protein
VAPILFLLLFGIIDYGLFFADDLGLRDGARLSARRGSLGDFGTAATCTDPTGTPRLGNSPTLAAWTVSAQLRSLACTAVNEASPVSGQVWVRIMLLDARNAEASSETAVSLRICLIEKHEGLLPLIPLPGGGVDRAKVQIMFESPDVAQTIGLAQGGGFDQQAPSGSDGPSPGQGGDPWGWCVQ